MAEEKLAKVKKKRWVAIAAPKLFEGDVLGESYTTNPNALIGRTITVNLMALTNDVKRQNTNIKFLINGVEGDNAVTELISYSIASSSIKRMVRKGRARIDTSFICFTADNKRVRVKPFLLITTSTKGSAAAALKKQAVEILKKEIKTMQYEDLIKNLIMYNVQRGLRDQLKKIFPIRACEIRELSIEREKKAVEKKPRVAEGGEVKAEKKAEPEGEVEEEPEAEEDNAEEDKSEEETEEPEAEKERESKGKKKPREEEKEEVAVSEEE